MNSRLRTPSEKGSRVGGAHGLAQVGQRGQAAAVEAGRAGALRGLAAAVLATGHVAHVRLHGGDRCVGAAQEPDEVLLARHRVRVAGLEPGTQHPRRHRRRLAAGACGQAAHDARGRAAHDEAQAQLGGLHLHAPRVPAVAAQPEQAFLGVVGQHAVAARGEQPGHGEVGGVASAADAPRWDVARHRRVVAGLVHALADVVLDRGTALIDPVRALAKAQVALAARGAEGHANVGHVGNRAAGDRGAQADRSAPARGNPHRQAAAGGIGGGHHGGERAARGAGADHPRGAPPHAPGAESQRPGGAATPPRGLAQQGAPAAQKVEVPGRGGHARRGRARGHRLRRSRYRRHRGVGREGSEDRHGACGRAHEGRESSVRIDSPARVAVGAAL